MRDAILGLVNPLIALIFAVTFFAIWQRERSRKEVLAFAGAYLMLGIGFLISQLMPVGYGRPGLSITNIPYFTGTVLLIWAAASRVGARLPFTLIWSAGAIGAVLIVVGQLFSKFESSDLYIANTLYGILFMLGAQATASTRDHSIANKLVFWMLALTAVQFFVRPTLSFMIEGALEHETYKQSAYYSALNATVAVNSLGLAIAFIAACVTDAFTAEKQTMVTDPLTGLLTRRAFEEEVNEAILRSHEKQTPLSMIVGDIDHFKNVNDIWGHQIGDVAISEFGQLINRTIRSGDFAGRIGGEEFCILVYDCDESGAVRLAERLRTETPNIRLGADTTLDVRISASFGVAGLRPGEGYKSLFARADSSLYEAKQNGRNRVERSKKNQDTSEAQSGGGAYESAAA
ncbi:diguanylate cyclase [Erythrobacter sp. YT30]|uniref:GGDEF domain-containing protein n=1 Tax=Erythrobacter sp. YT30 TaxID=1735012 RepID=UPI00076D30C5|nr:GGDEF domain-containing protein [Erythrobacter sp. YT30]KWV92612.1 hypothetical protein AUC45_00020 [Erythrobacter sp. YT30]